MSTDDRTTPASASERPRDEKPTEPALSDLEPRQSPDGDAHVKGGAIASPSDFTITKTVDKPSTSL